MYSFTKRNILILISGFLSLFLSNGFTFGMSVLYNEWLDAFDRPAWQTSLVQSVGAGVFNAGGLIAGMIITKIGPIKGIVVAGFLGAAGLGASVFANSILFLVVAIGIVCCFGMSLAYVCATSCVGKFYKGRYQLIALSFVYVGGAVGETCNPVILESLIQKYTWRGALLVFSGMMLHLIVHAALFTTSTTSKTTTKLQIGDSRNIKVSMIKIEKSSSNCDAGNPNQKFDSNCEHIKSNSERSVCENFRHLLRKRLFIFFMSAHAISLAVLSMIKIFLIDYWQTRGISRADAVQIYLYFNIVATIFRFAPGVLKKIPHFSVIWIPLIASIMGCISLALLVVIPTSFWITTVVASVYSISLTMAITMQGLSVLKFLGPDDFAAGLGLSMTVTGLVTIPTGPLLGYIRDATGSYDGTFYTVSAILFVTTVLFLVTLIIKWRDGQKHHIKDLIYGIQTINKYDEITYF